MAYWKFTKNILIDEPVEIYNMGNMARDMTYIDDVVDGILSAMNKVRGYDIFNLGNSKPVKLMDMVELIERYTGKTAKKRFLPNQPGDVRQTWADISRSHEILGYNPKISLADGLKRFVTWFLSNREWVLGI